ncbi:hypothetical protein ACT453_10910, partial [Bacillus sp. D-CC]
IQNAMIAHFTQADEDYGRRVKEGIEKKMKEAKTENKLPGREVSKSKYGQGSLAANEATRKRKLRSDSRRYCKCCFYVDSYPGF